MNPKEDVIPEMFEDENWVTDLEVTSPAQNREKQSVEGGKPFPEKQLLAEIIWYDHASTVGKNK